VKLSILVTRIKTSLSSITLRFIKEIFLNSDMQDIRIKDKILPINVY